MIILGLILMALFFAAVFFSLLAWSHRKSGITTWRAQMINPFNWLFMPELLTETGLKYRKVALSAWALYFGILAVSAILDALGLLSD